VLEFKDSLLVHIQNIHNTLITAKNLSLNPDQIIICYTYGSEDLYNILAGFILSFFFNFSNKRIL